MTRIINISRIFTVLVCLCYLNTVLGQDKKEEQSWVKEVIDLDLDVYGFTRMTGFESSRNTVNPDNRIAKLSESEIGTFIRPFSKISTKKFEVEIQPRITILTNLTNDSNVEKVDSEFYFQELKATFHLTSTLDFKFGRYVNNIGTSVFIRPSNPFNQNSGQLNPKIEVDPMDFAEVNLNLNNTSLHFISSIHEGRNDQYQNPLFDFKIKNALKFDYYGADSDLSFITSFSEDNALFFGINGRKNISQSILMWVDASYENNVDRFYPVFGHPTEYIKYNMENEIENDNWFANTILGASYSFKNGMAFQLEYFYNEKGFTEGQSELIKNIIDEESQYNFDLTKDLTDRNLARIIKPGMAYNRQNYLFSQISQNDIWSQFNYSLRYFHCLDDSSGQITALLEWYPFNNIEIFAVLLKSHGEAKTSFTQLIDNQVMAGAVVKF